MLGDVAAKIEMCRYFCWKTAHYLDQHDYHGEMVGAMCKIQCTEVLFDAVYKCMQVVGVNSVDRKHPFEKLLREATILPLYDAGNFGMQRRRVHGVIVRPDVQPARGDGRRAAGLHQDHGGHRHDPRPARAGDGRDQLIDGASYEPAAHLAAGSVPPACVGSAPGTIDNSSGAHRWPSFSLPG